MAGNKNVFRKNKTFYTKITITKLFINQNVVPELILVSSKYIFVHEGPFAKDKIGIKVIQDNKCDSPIKNHYSYASPSSPQF